MAIIQKYYVYEMSNCQFLSSAHGEHKKGGPRGTRAETRDTRVREHEGYLACIEIIPSHSHRNGGHGPIRAIRDGDA